MSAFKNLRPGNSDAGSVMPKPGDRCYRNKKGEGHFRQDGGNGMIVEYNFGNERALVP